jgi:hypothetical protein
MVPLELIFSHPFHLKVLWFGCPSLPQYLFARDFLDQSLKDLRIQAFHLITILFWKYFDKIQPRARGIQPLVEKVTILEFKGNMLFAFLLLTRGCYFFMAFFARSKKGNDIQTVVRLLAKRGLLRITFRDPIGDSSLYANVNRVQN